MKRCLLSVNCFKISLNILFLKLEKAQKESAVEKKDIKIKEERKTNEPYLTNLNEDPMLSYVICHFISNQVATIGSSPKNSIQLNGLSVMENHAIIKKDNNEIEIKAAQVGARIKVNGVDLTGSKVLEHKDRVLFGMFPKIVL
jgi:kinesin family protein 1